MKAKEIQDLIDYINNTGLEEVNIETSEFKIKVRRSSRPQAQIAETGTTTSPAQRATLPSISGSGSDSLNSESEVESNYLTIRAPMIGTFYVSSNAETESFVNIGDKISSGKTVCIIEAMKLFNEIESEVSGTIVKVLVENAQPVEFDQPLFLVDPS